MTDRMISRDEAERLLDPRGFGSPIFYDPWHGAEADLASTVVTLYEVVERYASGRWIWCDATHLVAEYRERWVPLLDDCISRDFSREPEPMSPDQARVIELCRPRGEAKDG